MSQYQKDNQFSAMWIDTTTAPGVLLTGLPATIIITRKDTNVIVVNNAPMTEVLPGEYDYIYLDMIEGVSYSYRMNPNSPLAFIETGFTTPIPIGGYGGGGGFIDLTEKNNEVLKEFKEFKEILKNNKIDYSQIQKFIKNIKFPEPNIDISPLVQSQNSFLSSVEKKIEEVKSQEFREIKENICNDIKAMKTESEEEAIEKENMRNTIVKKDEEIHEMSEEIEDKSKYIESLESLIDVMKGEEEEIRKHGEEVRMKKELIENTLKKLSQ